MIRYMLHYVVFDKAFNNTEASNWYSSVRCKKNMSKLCKNID